jgi:hypothetical protein
MDLSISQAHTTCVAAFLALIKASHIPYTERSNEAQDIFDKYKLWAGNVGAIHSMKRYKLSLDYRLREASFYKSQVLLTRRSRYAKTHVILDIEVDAGSAELRKKPKFRCRHLSQLSRIQDNN